MGLSVQDRQLGRSGQEPQIARQLVPSDLSVLGLPNQRQLDLLDQDFLLGLMGLWVRLDHLCLARLDRQLGLLVQLVQYHQLVLAFLLDLYRPLDQLDLLRQLDRSHPLVLLRQLDLSVPHRLSVQVFLLVRSDL